MYSAIRLSLVAVLSTGWLLVGITALTASPTVDVSQQVKDAYISGKLDTLYTFNRQLNAFDIEARVERGVVYLTGTVATDVERELAGELAKNIEGVAEVRNALSVGSSGNVSRAERDGRAKRRAEMRGWVEDASTTAIVKSKLLANQNTRDLNIQVGTRNKIVTLSGLVTSAEERQLAELLARNTENVVEVRNELAIDTDRAAHMDGR